MEFFNTLTNVFYAIFRLKELDQSPIAAGNMPQKITLSHDGRSAYVINAADNTINVFSRNIVNGELTLLEVGAKLPTGKLPVDMVISNDDRFLYVTNLNSSTVYEYQRYGNVLKLYAKLKTLSSPIEISISNDDKYLYIANSGDNVTSQYTINQLDGSIEPDAKPTVACGSLPTAMAASQKNKLILVTAQQTDELYLYKIN
ncbi:MAG: beta-propeller fold lactonase family protein [Burkholderiales bacterium]|nr:beta-propeller fold lactonase family protein [Burkholderiales bacterium]